MERAEERALNFDYDDSKYWLYHSAKFSEVYYNGEPLAKQEEIPPAAADGEEGAEEEEDEDPHVILRFNWGNYTEAEYLDLWLEEKKPLFYGIPINLTHSSVHVPDNVFDHGESYSSRERLSVPNIYRAFGSLLFVMAVLWSAKKTDPAILHARSTFNAKQTCKVQQGG